MERRSFVKSILAGGLLVPAAADGYSTGGRERIGLQQGHAHDQVSGPLANATVSFGAWPALPYDRLAPPAPGPPPNVHAMIPYTVTVKEGGSVNFIVAGYHNIAVYEPGKTVEDVDVDSLLTLPGVPQPLINDEVGRVFRGAFGPVATFPQDRVEVVQFSRRGLHLVICAFRPHFVNDNMYGWVKVV